VTAPYNIAFYAGNSFISQMFSDVTTRSESHTHTHTLLSECVHCISTANISLFWNDTEYFEARFQEKQFPNTQHTLSLSCPYPATDNTILYKNPAYALIYVHTMLFTLKHSYMFPASRGMVDLMSQVNKIRVQM